MRKLLLIALLLISTQMIYAQGMHSLDLKWGREMPIVKKTTVKNILLNNESGIFTYSTKIKGPILIKFSPVIQHFDKKFNLKKSLDVVVKLKKKKLKVEHITSFGGEIYVFATYPNQKTKKNELYVQTVNTQKMLLNKDIRKIAEIDYSGHGKYNSGDFYFNTSSDTSKLLITYEPPYDKKNKVNFGFSVFNEKMNNIWSNDVRLPYSSKLFDMESIKVDYKGDVYVIGRLFKEKRRYVARDGSPNFTYQIISIANDGKKINEYEAKLDDKFITDIQVEIAPNDDIVCAGFYSDKGTYTIRGSFYLSIDAESKNIKNTGMKRFDKKFMMQTMTEKERKRANRKAKKGKELEMQDYELDEIIMRSDGGAILVAEQFDIHVVTHRSSNGVTTSTTYYYYDNIIVVNIKPDGQIDWATTIPKHQLSTNDGGYYSSYVLSVVGDKMYFIFNDNEENLNWKPGDEIENTRYNSGLFGNKSVSTLACVMVDGKGTQERFGILSQKDIGVITRPKVSKQISDNELIIYGVKRKKQRFGKITFE